MKVEVFPSELAGVVIAPGSKSVAQRMVACALLARGESVIHDFPESEDCRAALDVAQALGAVITAKGNVVSIKGGFPHAFLSGIRNPKSEVQCGESGLTSRMFTPIAALHNQPITLLGKGSLIKRSFKDYLSVLPDLNVKVETENGLLPITVCGPLQHGVLSMDASSSSQFLTGLLTALPKTGGESIIRVSNLKSKPYVEMTLEILRRFGVKIEHRNLEEFIIYPSNFEPQTLRVPGDWSAAAFLLVAGALCADNGLRIENLNTDLPQADNSIVDVLIKAGVTVTREADSVTVKTSEIKAFEFDANDCPDLFPPLAALAAFADGVSTIYGVKRLTYKESNRGKTLQQEFAKANIRIVLRKDEMKIYPAHIRPAVINSHNDHRIAMSATILGLAGARMTIRGAQCVAKSYPDFFSVMQSVNAKVNIHQSASD